MLGVRDTVTADSTTAEVGNTGNIAGGPHALEDGVTIFDAEIRASTDALALIEGNTRATEHGLGFHASSPDHDVGLECHPVGERQLAIHSTGELGVEVDEGLTLL